MTDKEMKDYYDFRMCELWRIPRNIKEKLLTIFKVPSELFHIDIGSVQRMEFLTEREKRLLCEEIGRDEGKAEEDYLRFLENRGHFTCIGRDDYPSRLLNVHNAPYGLFYYGKLPDEGQMQIAVVGSRACSEYGKAQAKQFSEAVVHGGGGIISGMAMGVDVAAGTAAWKAGGFSCAVLGCGIDICYPASSQELYWKLREEGCIISEFSCGTKPLAQYFPSRNRIISGLSDIVLVVEARQKSGSLITADMALDQGRDVYAVPGRVGDVLSFGCNYLIHQGAGIAFDPEEWMIDIGLKTEKQDVNGAGNRKSGKDSRSEEGRQSKKGCRSERDGKSDTGEKALLTGEERIIFELAEANPRPIDYFADNSHMPYLQVLGLLVDLQVKGLLKETGRDHYCRNW